MGVNAVSRRRAKAAAAARRPPQLAACGRVARAALLGNLIVVDALLLAVQLAKILCIAVDELVLVLRNGFFGKISLIYTGAFVFLF